MLPVRELIEASAAVDAFAEDWAGAEAWLAPRLRDEKGWRQTIFEFRAGFYWQSVGHRVEYVAPQRQRGPDLCLVRDDGDVFVECVQMDTSAGQQVRQDTAEEISRRLLRFMRRTGHNRLIALRCAKHLEPKDTDTLAAKV